MTLSTLLVTDTNIWIDLKNGDVLEKVFSLPANFILSVFASQEFHEDLWTLLLNLGARAEELDTVQIIEVYRLRQNIHSVSIYDLSALVLARDLSAVLLTGDDPLRRCAVGHGIETHGILWLLDELVCNRVITKSQAASSLKRMCDRGARLPSEEVETRLKARKRN